MSDLSKEQNISISDEWEPPVGGDSLMEIVLRHIRKISDITCQELTQGYWDEKPVKTSGGMMLAREYHPDLRIAYCNAISFLVDITYPLSDKDFKQYIDNNDKEDKNIDERLMCRRKVFRQMCIMFERTDFFKPKGVSNE